jgi:hypothetical protein
LPDGTSDDEETKTREAEQTGIADTLLLMTTTTINTTTEHIKIIRSVHFIQIVHF